MVRKPIIAALCLAAAAVPAAWAADFGSTRSSGDNSQPATSDAARGNQTPRYSGDDQSSGSLSRDTSTSNVGSSTTRDDAGSTGVGVGGSAPVTGAGGSGTTGDSGAVGAGTAGSGVGTTTSPMDTPDTRYGTTPSTTDSGGTSGSATTGGGAGGAGTNINEPVQVGPMFMSIDINHDGFISRDESRRSAALRGRFDELDTDGDGRVSTSEFRQGEQPRQ